MSKKNKNKTSVETNDTACVEFASFREGKQGLIDIIEEFEPFGLYTSHCIKKAYPHLLSTEVVQPKTIKEFGADVSTFGLGETFLKMVVNLCIEGLKIRILKTAAYFLNENYLIRQCSADNKYPDFYHAEKVKVLGGDQEIEIVFFAESKENAERIKNRIRYTMEEGWSLQSYVDDMLEDDVYYFMDEFLDDSMIQKIVDTYNTMTTAHYQSLLKKKGTKND